MDLCIYIYINICNQYNHSLLNRCIVYTHWDSLGMIQSWGTFNYEYTAIRRAPCPHSPTGKSAGKHLTASK